jgi:hypothetical protein
MGFSLPFGKERKMRKFMENYFKDRVSDKIAFHEQIKILDAQLNDKQIEQQTYERLRTILMSYHYQKQKEEWVKLENKFNNTFNQ